MAPLALFLFWCILVSITKDPFKKEDIMARKSIDCRDYPGKIKCTLALSADTEEELLEAAVQHSITVHGQQDTPEFRAEIKKGFKEASSSA